MSNVLLDTDVIQVKRDKKGQRWLWTYQDLSSWVTFEGLEADSDNDELASILWLEAKAPHATLRIQRERSIQTFEYADLFCRNWS